MVNKFGISPEQLNNIIDTALNEDIGSGDVTSDTLIPPGLHGRAYLLVKAEGVLAGIDLVREIFRRVDPALTFDILFQDGSRIKRGDIIATVSGRVSSILTPERVSLNFLQKLSGIATQTAQLVVGAGDLPVTILDTRKTTPGLRALERYAVRVGGGKNHRFNLTDLILIKDNHLVAMRALGMSLKEIIAKARENSPLSLKIEVEVTSPEEALEAVEAGADIIMPDNMSPDEMRHLISLLPFNVKTEASGGVTVDNIREVAASGVNFISSGALTHSTKALDISIELEPDSVRLL
ncbi:MAG: carboxylating nicotinate-nucleotide diphosphorylase [Dehalococcoidales bacterium]|nr:carboxylating nicotinate-nucleotide diphosphorylase [Dehalococcoidales bacterium]